MIDLEGIVRYGATGFNESAIRALIESYLPGIVENTTQFPLVENLIITPNPAKTNSLIRFNLAKNQAVKIWVYSSSGKLITTIFDGKLSAGAHRFSWVLRDNKGRSVYQWNLPLRDYYGNWFYADEASSSPVAKWQNLNGETRKSSPFFIFSRY